MRQDVDARLERVSHVALGIHVRKDSQAMFVGRVGDRLVVLQREARVRLIDYAGSFPVSGKGGERILEAVRTERLCPWCRQARTGVAIAHAQITARQPTDGTH